MSRYADEIRSLALSFPEAYEDEPWGHPVFKVGDNRMLGDKLRTHAPLMVAPEYYDSSAMTLLAYAVRRTIGAAVVFLIVVLLTMFAVGSVGLPGWRSENGPIPDFVNPWYGPWASFPTYALSVLGLAAVGAIAWRLAARRR